MITYVLYFDHLYTDVWDVLRMISINDNKIWLKMINFLKEIFYLTLTSYKLFEFFFTLDIYLSNVTNETSHTFFSRNYLQ
jgi:hypothetical protein